MRIRLHFPLLALLLAIAPCLLAQSARWDPPGGSLGLNQVSELALIFEDCEPEEFQLPTVDGLVVGRPSVSRQSTFSLGTGGRTSSSTHSLVYPVRPTKRATLRVPSFSVNTSAGRVTVPEAVFSVEDAPSGAAAGRVSLDDIATARLTSPSTTLWAGEVVPLTYTLSVVRNRYYALDPNLQWQPAPFITEEWTKPNPTETVVRGERRVVSTQTTRALAKEPGNFSLGPVSQVVQLIVGTSGISLFAQPVVEPRQLLTAPLDLTVRPLPPAPSDFSGAVGQFSFVSRIVPLAASVNEPITWTIELGGVGNWPDIAGLPGREVSNDFSVVQPKSKRTMKDGSLFEGTLSEDVVLVPTRAGTYTLGPVRFTYFDPKAGSYRTLTTDTVTVTVGSAAAPAPGPAGSPRFTLPPIEDPAAAPQFPTAVAPAPPENLPRDPLPTPRRGVAPWPVRKLVIVAASIALAVPLALWLALAALRSRANDRHRRRREARGRLGAILAQLRESGAGAARNDRLRAWQRETIELWEVRHAAPASARLHACVSAFSRDAAGAWTRLWQEAERALHGPGGKLAEDWLLRAEGALRAVRIPGWPAWSLFSPRNLLPAWQSAMRQPGRLAGTAFIVIIGIALLFIANSAEGAESPADAYRRGDFGAAESGWRASVAAAPTDWAARHDLGLALAQQDRWFEAAAHWASAFLLQPRADATRWDLALGLQRSGMAPPELVAFSRGEGRHWLARLASAGEWHLLIVGASVLLAGALALLLMHAYRHLGSWVRPVALTASIVSVLAAGAATFSLRTYGDLAHPDAAIVWRSAVLRSIPTEADTTQKTSPLSPGLLAVADRSFLGWSRLTFPGGQSGWVRTDDILKLYR